MNFIQICVKRPIAVGMMYLIVASLGLYFCQKLPLEPLPNTNSPSLFINSRWPNTSAETVEAFVTSPIEGVANTLKGVEEIISRSSEGISVVEMTLAKGTDLDFAKLELSEKLSVLKKDLPTGVDMPRVTQFVPISVLRGFPKAPPLRYTLTGSYTLSWIRQYAIDELKTPLMAIEGVGDVTILGGQDQVLKIEIDPGKAELYGIPEGLVNYVISTLEVKRNIGYLMRSDTRYDVYVENNAENVGQIGELVVQNRNGTFVLLKDIATITQGHEEPQDHHRINGNALVSIVIDYEDDTNIIDFVEAITVKIDKLKSEFPVGLEILQENDPSRTVRENLDNIRARGVFSLLVVFLILFIFIWNVKVPLIVMTTVGFSVLITIIFFYMFGIGFNVMTIAGLALSIGMLVDSSIVVIDNIFRYREQGLSPAESAEKGAREVFLPITAAVMTTSIVFIPFLYLQGDNKGVYIPMAFAVIFSLLSSIIVAFTFIPTYSLKVFPGDSESIRESIEKNKVIMYVSGVYGRFIEYVIHHKYWTLGTVLFLFVGSWAIFQYTVPSFGMFGGSQGDTYIRIGVRLPPGSVLERADDIARSFEEMVIGRENIRKVTTDVLTTQMTVDIRFTEEALDTAFPFMLKDEMTSYGSTFAGVSVTVSGVGDYFSQGGFGGGSAASFRVYINGYNYNRCAEIAESLGRQFAQIPRVKNVDTNYFGRRDRYDTVLNIKRDALGAYDLSVSTVINILDKYVRRNVISSRSITIDDEIVKYAVKIKDYDTLELEDLKNILITTPGGEQLRLSQIAEFSEQKVTGSIRRADQQYERIVGLEYRGPTQKGREIVQGIIDNQVFPHGYTVKERSQFFNPFTTREIIYKWLAILFAVVLVYMVTSSLYESLLHPFVIILTVPMALIGVFLIFFAMGKTFNDSAYIGVILLAGIVVNNSIILVDHINLLRRKGLGLYEAVVQGSKDRVRPILMTSATTIMGMMPLIWAGQSRFYDQQIWYSLALASIGGLLSATPLTLSVTPVLYILFEEWRSKVKGQWKELGNESIIS